MRIKRIIAGLGAVALLSGGVGVVGAATAAAQVAMSIQVERTHVEVGDTLAITVSPECQDSGGALEFLADGEDITALVGGDGPYSLPVTADMRGSFFGLQARCVLAEGEPTYSDEIEISVFGAQWIVSEPSPFTTGQEVRVTAGDFRPDAQVQLTVFTDAGTEVFSASLGSAADDFSASATVVFPASLEPAQYQVRVTDGDNVVETYLTIGEEPTPSPSPEPTPEESPEPEESPTPEESPSPEESPTPDDSPSPDDRDDDEESADVSPTPTPTAPNTSPIPVQPGLPNTGR